MVRIREGLVVSPNKNQRTRFDAAGEPAAPLLARYFPNLAAELLRGRRNDEPDLDVALAEGTLRLDQLLMFRDDGKT